MTFPLLFLMLAGAGAQSQNAPATRGTSNLEIRVTDRVGTALGSAHVKVHGISEREGDTSISGRVTFRGMRAGTYMLRIERDRFILIEKEFTMRPAIPGTVIAALPSSLP